MRQTSKNTNFYLLELKEHRYLNPSIHVTTKELSEQGCNSHHSKIKGCEMGPTSSCPKKKQNYVQGHSRFVLYTKKKLKQEANTKTLAPTEKNTNVWTNIQRKVFWFI